MADNQITVVDPVTLEGILLNIGGEWLAEKLESLEDLCGKTMPLDELVAGIDRVMSNAITGLPAEDIIKIFSAKLRLLQEMDVNAPNRHELKSLPN